MKCLRKRLSIIQSSNSEQDQLEIRIELDKHLEDVWSEAQVNGHLLFLPILLGLAQPDHRCLQIWVLCEGVCLRQDQGLIDIENDCFPL